MAVVVTFMSIVCVSKTALATAATTPLGSSTFSSSSSSSSTDVAGSENKLLNSSKYNHHIQQKNNQKPSVLANQGTTMLPPDNRRVFKKVKNHTNNGIHRRSYSSSVSASLAAALNGLQHISTSYNPHATATATVDHHLDNSNKMALDAKQQIPIYEEQQDDYAIAAGASAVTRENNQHQQHQQQPSNGNSALSDAIYNLNQAGVHNNNYSPNVAYASTPTATTKNTWNYPSKSLTMDWNPSSESGQQFLDTSDDKNSVSNFRHHYEHNSGYNSPTYSYESPPISPYESLSENQNQNHDAQYYTQNLFQPNDATSYYSQLPYAADQQNAMHEDNEESYNYFPKTTQENNFESTESGQHQQPPDVINYVPYPLVKKLHVPVRQNVQIPVSHPIIIPIRKPVPIHIPITQQVQVPGTVQELKIPVERVVPYPVEKHFPINVERGVPYPVYKFVAVKVPYPYPIKVPIYKTILHKMKSLW